METRPVELVVVAAGNVEEFSDYVFDQLVLLNQNVMSYVPGADRVQIDGVEHRYLHSLADMNGASGFVFVGSWYLREDSTRILDRAKEISSV